MLLLQGYLVRSGKYHPQTAAAELHGSKENLSDRYALPDFPSNNPPFSIANEGALMLGKVKSRQEKLCFFGPGQGYVKGFEVF